MNNEYAFTPNINLDLVQIRKIVLENLDSRIPGMATHHRLVESSQYLTEIRNQYPFLSTIYNIYPTSQGYTTPIHIDSGRNCALNIPISNTENSHTVFYEAKDIKVEDIKDRVYHKVLSSSTEVFRFTLLEPTVINTKVPHGVFDSGTETRIIMSWSISSEYTYNDIRGQIGPNGEIF